MQFPIRGSNFQLIYLIELQKGQTRPSYDDPSAGDAPKLPSMQSDLIIQPLENRRKKRKLIGGRFMNT
jgi:hypothetical protein